MVMVVEAVPHMDDAKRSIVIFAWVVHQFEYQFYTTTIPNELWFAY